MLVRIGSAIVLSMAVMVFTLPLYSANAHALSTADASTLAVQWTALLKYASLILTLPVFVLLGVPLFMNAIEQYRLGFVTTDALIVTGVAAALCTSVFATLTESGHTYFETICMLLVLVTIGRYLETRGKLRASEALLSLESLLPSEVEVLRDEKPTRVSADQLIIGDRVYVPAGQTIPVDGIVESGQAHVDEQIVTGESRPISKSVGHSVIAGSSSLDGALTIRTVALGSESTVGRLTSLLDDAIKSRGRLELFADKLSRFFLPVVIILAGIGGLVGWQAVGIGSGIQRALAVLLISCPCALGIATPLAAWITLGRAARRGVLFRSGIAMENLAVIRAIVFDKTGTLTTGLPTVREFMVDKSHHAESRELLSLAAGIGRTSKHVLAEAVVDFARCEGIEPARIVESRTDPGYGLTGTFNGHIIRLGSVAMMSRESANFKNGLGERAQQAMANGHSVACLALDQTVTAIATFDESLRSEAKDAIAQTKQLGLHVEVLTGDHTARAAAIEKQLGVRTHGGLKPSQKIERLNDLRSRSGKVAMVGDGLNDAPALAAADVGIAMGCGADISRESADICLLGNDLTSIPWAVRLAKQTVRIIKGNLTWAFIYNACCIPLAIAGKLTPVLAAVAMVLSSLFVVMNSSRLRTVKFYG